jgi:imidazolonepropionase-like amidohydrolase
VDNRSDTTSLIGATLIDGTGSDPQPNCAIVIKDGRIESVGALPEDPNARTSREIDLSGKYVIPGMLDANVHLVLHVDPDVLLRYDPGEYDELVLEAAQVALRAGVTTVFDTCGPLESLRRVRDRINVGERTGSRIFFAGNIIGNGGPYSEDMFPNVAAGLSSIVVDEVNRHWEQGVGAELTWMPADEVRARTREYIASSGIDFVKFASSSHAHSRFIALSPDAQRAIVEEAHAAELTAQACTQSPEALKLSIDAGVDLLQHGDVTGLWPIPAETLELILQRRLPCVAFLYTKRYSAAMRERKPRWHSNAAWGEMMAVKDLNDRQLVASGARLLLANDMGVYGPTAEASPRMISVLGGLPDAPMHLGRSHIAWLRAAWEHGMGAMDALMATTRNIAEAYDQADQLGTIEPGKRADLVALDASPLEAPENYERIAFVMKDGEVVDRSRLPEHPVLTRSDPR